MEAYGILSAPQVKLLVKSGENGKATITPIISCIKGINKTTEKVYRDDSGARNIIKFVQNKEEKKVLLLLSEESTEAYSINRIFRTFQ